MAIGSRICPNCGALNPSEERRCHRCQERLPGAFATGALDLVHSTLGSEYLATKALAIGCVLVFLFSSIGKGDFPLWFGQSIRWSELVRWGGLVDNLSFIEPWRHLSAVFVHSNGLHILFNMLALASFGRVTEERFGSGRFILIFVATGIAGFVASDFWYLLWYGGIPPTLGASGAVFGIIGAQAGEAWASGAPDWRARVLRAIGLAVLLFLLFGLGSMGVNNAAHFGGLFSGLSLGYAFGKERRPYRRDKLFKWLAMGLLAFSAVSVLLSHRSPAWRMVRQAEIEAERT